MFWVRKLLLVESESEKKNVLEWWNSFSTIFGYNLDVGMYYISCKIRLMTLVQTLQNKACFGRFSNWATEANFNHFWSREKTCESWRHLLYKLKRKEKKIKRLHRRSWNNIFSKKFQKSKIFIFWLMCLFEKWSNKLR